MLTRKTTYPSMVLIVNWKRYCERFQQIVRRVYTLHLPLEWSSEKMRGERLQDTTFHYEKRTLSMRANVFERIEIKTVS